MTKLITDSDGSVSGIRIRSGYKFSDAKSGVIKHIRAKRAVVLATGGFSRDINFRRLQNPLLD